MVNKQRPTAQSASSPLLPGDKDQCIKAAAAAHLDGFRHDDLCSRDTWHNLNKTRTRVCVRGDCALLMALPLFISLIDPL